MLVRRKLKAPYRPSRKRRRSSRGVYLLETLVSITIGGILALALLQMLTGSMRTMTVTRNETQAHEIMQELCDLTILYGYERLSLYPGDHTLLLNRATVGEVGPDVHKRPLFLNTVTKQWNQKSIVGSGTFAVTYSVGESQVIDGVTALEVTVKITWADSNFSTRRLERTLTVFEGADESS